VFPLELSLPIPGIIDPKIYAIPYVILIVIVAVVALALFIKMPSLRNYRRKRSIVFYAVLFLALILLSFQAYNVSSRAFVSYHGEFDDKLLSETTNKFSIACNNRGDRSCSFDMVIRSVNASFPDQSQPNCVQIDSNTVKVHFTLSENLFMYSPTEAAESLFFDIDENVTGFSFSILPDSQSNGCTFVAGQPYVSYIWNGTENCFVLHKSGGWMA
jgi:hypothetical protein